jgi:hypothetical protein
MAVTFVLSQVAALPDARLALWLMPRRAGRCVADAARGSGGRDAGEIGAGKTTLVKPLAKMYGPTSGSILVDDTPLVFPPRSGERGPPARSSISSASYY